MKLKALAGPALTIAAALLVACAAYAGVSRVEDGIEFTYDDPSAGSVSLAGSFNNWDMNAQPLTKDEDGVWRAVIQLDPGDYEYKFVVNGSEWIADPENPRIVGDYGNSGLTIDENGDPVSGGAGSAISNTPVNSRVMINGWYRATYNTQSDVPSDPRWRLTRPEHEIYIGVNPTVTDKASGSAMLRVSTGSGDIKEISAEIYSGHATLEGGPFSVTGFYNEERIQYDNPLESIGHMDLPYTIPEEHIPFGRGAQGIVLDTDFWDVGLNVTYASMYDYDIMNDPSIYDNTDTDLLAARAKRAVGPVTLGATYTSWRDGWWIDWTGTNSSPHIDAYKEESGSTSDWFELSNTETWMGVDATWPAMPGMLEVSGEYSRYSFESLWDMGNREKVEGEDYSNGAIDVPVGSADGWVGKLVLDAMPVAPLDLRLEVLTRAIDAMDTNDLYVAFDNPSWMAVPQGEYTEVKYDGSPLSLTVFGPAPDRDEMELEFDAGFAFGIFDLGLEYDRDSYTWEYVEPIATTWGDLDKYEMGRSRISGRVGASVSEKLHLGVATERVTDEYETAPVRDATRFETILTGQYEFVPDWKFIVDFRSVSYEDYLDLAGSSGETLDYRDECYCEPYVALSYSPRENVEIRIGYGVDPTSYQDTPVEGRANGRERWLSEYLWDHSEHNILDAEEALSDARTIGVMAVITF